MNQDKRQKGLAAAIPLLVIASLMAAGSAEADGEWTVEPTESDRILTVGSTGPNHGSGVETAVDVVTGWDYTCVLTSRGNVDCYGRVPGAVGYVADGDAVGVAAGGEHTCILRSSGNVDCYGYNNYYGQVADYMGGDAVGVAAGAVHTCILTSSGNVDCYGAEDNFPNIVDFGQAADYWGGEALDVAAGGLHTCVLLKGGNVDCYGSNFYGKAEDYVGGDAVEVATGGDHTCVLRIGGDVDCYGAGEPGGTGWADRGQSSDYPLNEEWLVGVTVDHFTGGDAIGVAAGGYHTCVLLKGGDVDCYGDNSDGQAASYNWFQASYSSWLQGVNYPQWNDQMAVGVAAGGYHTCVLLKGGDVHCYGDNSDGQAANWYGDSDGDGVLNDADNCRSTSNPGQEDMDGDGVGDACDDDIDGDGWSNDVETLCGSDPMDAGSTPPPCEPVKGDAGCDTLTPGLGDTITCWAWLSVAGDRFIDIEEDVTVPAQPIIDHDAGCSPATPSLGETVSCWAWVEVNGDRIIDEERTMEPLGGGSQTAEKQLLHEDNVTVTPSQDVPPEDQEGTETPDYPGTDPEPTPDYPGTDPEPTPGAGERVATVTVRNQGELVCVDVTPEGSSTIPVSCLDRARLGPADGHIPRGDTEVVYLSEEDTPDVPGTDPEPIPDVPGTDPEPVPDGPPVPGGLVTAPHVTVTVDASYRYDATRLNHEGSFLGIDVWSPVGPGDETWYVASGGDVGMTVTVFVYEDGEHVATVPVSVPYLGQALAAAEATAGTL